MIFRVCLFVLLLANSVCSGQEPYQHHHGHNTPEKTGVAVGSKNTLFPAIADTGINIDYTVYISNDNYLLTNKDSSEKINSFQNIIKFLEKNKSRLSGDRIVVSFSVAVPFERIEPLLKAFENYGYTGFMLVCPP